MGIIMDMVNRYMKQLFHYRKTRCFIAVIFLGILFTAYQKPDHANAESTSDKEVNVSAEPSFKTDTEYKSDVTQPVVQAVDNYGSIKKWDSGCSTSSLKAYPESRDGAEVENKVKELSVQITGSLDKFLMVLDGKFSSDYTAILQMVEYRKAFVGGLINRDTVSITPVTAVPLKKTLPQPDADAGGIPYAPEIITASYGPDMGSQPIREMADSDSSIIPNNGGYTVFCAVQKQKQWITRKQTLF